MILSIISDMDFCPLCFDAVAYLYYYCRRDAVDLTANILYNISRLIVSACLFCESLEI